MKQLRIEAILLDWYKNGIETVEQAERYVKSRSEKHNFVKSKPADTFNDYKQRSYDYDELEKRLLGWDSALLRRN